MLLLMNKMAMHRSTHKHSPETHTLTHTTHKDTDRFSVRAVFLSFPESEEIVSRAVATPTLGNTEESLTGAGPTHTHTQTDNCH